MTSRMPDLTQFDFDAVALAQEFTEPNVDSTRWSTPEGIDVATLYRVADLGKVRHLAGQPGFPPFVRGPYPTMYVRQPWTIRQ